jgi:hypothetical protein
MLMARIEFPSGAWIEYRDELTAADRFAVQDLVHLEYKDGYNRVKLGFGNDVRNALLGRIITAWSYSVPTPAGAKDFAAADVIIGNVMSLRDYNVLSVAVEPLVKEVQGINPEEDPKDSSAT